MSNHNSREILIDGDPVSREKFDKVYPPEEFGCDPNRSFVPKSVEIETRIREYEFRIDSLKKMFLWMIQIWKRDAEKLLKMLVEDRLQVLKNKKDLFE